ncbi:MAG: PEP-CTERM sorting domain-containing protein [Planctomycetota bacterium]|jgi:hypothetical protein
MFGWKSLGKGAALLGLVICISITVDSVQASLTPAAGYQIKHQINSVFTGPIDMVSDGQLVTGTTAYTPEYDSLLEVRTVDLDAGPMNPVIYTQTTLPSGSTYANWYASTDGDYVLTGQTGYPANAQGLTPGRTFLTKLSDGSTAMLDVAGNFDAASASGQFYMTASAGTATGLSDNGYSGLYQVERSAGTLTGLNLLLDTGAPSGIVAGNGSGDLAFSLGGVSAKLTGSYNDLYLLTADQVADGVAAGQTTGVSGNAADPLISATELNAATASFFNQQTPSGGSVFASMSDMIFDKNGDLILSMSGYVYDSGSNWVGTIGMGMLLDLAGTAGNYSATVSDILYTNASDGGGFLAYRGSDDVLWVSTDGNLYGLTVPEPATLTLLLLGGLGIIARRAVRGIEKKRF